MVNKDTSPSKQQERHQRLSAALRLNLHKRKQQQREREALNPPLSPESKKEKDNS